MVLIVAPNPLGQQTIALSQSVVDAIGSAQAIINARKIARRIGISDIYSASGDTTIIAAPAAGVEIVVSEIILQNNVATLQSAQIKRGEADTNPIRVRMNADSNGIATPYTEGNELRLGAATALVLNLSAETGVTLTIRYWLETVATGMPIV
jgi:hypothetical protein